MNFDCSAMWVKNSAYVVDALSVKQDILYSKENQGGTVSDFKDWQVRGPLQDSSGAMHGTILHAQPSREKRLLRWVYLP